MRGTGPKILRVALKEWGEKKKFESTSSFPESERRFPVSDGRQVVKKGETEAKKGFLCKGKMRSGKGLNTSAGPGGFTDRGEKGCA